MNRVAIAAVVLCLTAPIGLVAQAKDQRISKNLLNKAADAIEEIEKVSERLDKTIEQHAELIGKEKIKDRQKEHRKLQEELTKMEEAVDKVRRKTGEMEKEAEEFFAEWDEDLRDIGDAELRATSRNRYDTSRLQYSEIIGAGREAADNYDAFIVGMRDELATLERDLSDDAIAQTMPKTREKVDEVRSAVNALTHKIEGYIIVLQ